jgi:C1A family cysteine protease
VRNINLLPVVGVLLLFLFSCKKEHSSEDIKQVKEDSLPSNYPFATGYCDGVSLGISIADTNIYLPDTSALLPVSILLDMPTPGDQGIQGSCTAWATVYGVATYYSHLKSGKPYSDTGNLSPKFTYNQIAKGNCNCTSFLDNLYLLKTQGACALSDMAYDENECSKQPDSIQTNKAESYTINDWRKVNLHNLTLVKQAVLAKKPVLFAIAVDEGFATIAFPYIWKARVGSIGQQHAMIIVGYDDNKKAFKIMNSWSTAWGDKGFAWIDYDFFLKNASQSGYLVI